MPICRHPYVEHYIGQFNSEEYLMNMSQKGFTLMEMIGVMAVIAILASIATPKIFAAIDDAKVSAFVQEANNLKLVTAQYYKDTGNWPRHIPSHANSKFHNLMINDKNGSGKKIPGWKGPYLDREMKNQVQKGGYQEVIATANKNWTCDLDGDGNADGRFLVYRADGISDTLAQKISDILDGDGDISSGKKRWQAAGRVKRYGVKSNHKSSLLYCITKI